ncbi:MAG: TonB-dependent receptor [Thermodesulfobacteria bacterium]|nr:TonB-dependent receptor [Thermodesulfobacteriota bacterium]
MKKVVPLLCMAMAFNFAVSNAKASVVSNSTNSTSLSEIVVTATRIEEPIKNVAPFVEVITSSDIKDSTAQDAGDAMIEAGLGHVHKYPGVLTSRVEIRGLSTNLFDMEKSRVLLLIDGHLAGTVNMAKIPLDDVEKIEIVKGPSSVLYGSQAMGGVINIITKNPPKKPGLKSMVGVELGSWSYYKGKAEVKGKKGIFGFYLLGTRSHQGDYKAKDYGEIKNSSYNEEYFSGKVALKNLIAGIKYYKGWKIGSPGGTYNPDPNDYSNKKRTEYSLKYELKDIKAQVFYVKDEDEWHDLNDTSGATVNITYKTTKTTGASLQKEFSFKFDKVLIGGDWNQIKVESHKLSGAPYFPNSKYNTYGAFLENKLYLMNEKFIISGGIRYDYFKDEILATPGLTVTPQKRDIDHFTYRGGMVFKVNSNLSLKANAGTGFRAPAPDELAANYVSSWGTRYIGNPNLSPEKSFGIDGGFVYTTPTLKTEVDYFYNKFKDKILCIFDSSLNAMTFKNVEGAKIQGFEANISVELAPILNTSFSVEPFTNLTYYTQLKNEDPTEVSKYGPTLLYTPKWTGTFGIKFASEKWDARITGTYIGKEKVIDWDWTSPTYGKAVEKGSFTIFNFACSIRPVKHLELTAKISNLFNKAYEYVQYYPMPERSYYIGATLKF